MFESFLCNIYSIFDEAVFCFGEKQRMLVNDDCSSCYNRVSDFAVVGLVYIGERKFCMMMDQHVIQSVKPTPLQSANSIRLSVGDFILLNRFEGRCTFNNFTSCPYM